MANDQPQSTVTVIVPSGYRSVCEFLKDCGIERAPRPQTTQSTSMHECPGEEVGAAMHDYIVATYGRKPTTDEFSRIYWHWEEEVERVFG